MIRKPTFKSAIAVQFDGVLAWLVFGIPTFLLITVLWGLMTTPYVSVAQFEKEHQGPLRIPKIIHQTYKNNKLPESWKDTPRLWNKTHPGWKYEFWTDDRNRKFIVDHYPWFLKQYDSYPNNIQRADSIRYFILYHYGGVYADLDIQPLRNIEPMLLGSEVMLPETPNVGLTNAFMAAIPQSDYMKYVTEQLETYADQWYHFTRHWQIITSTGPAFIWKLANKYEGTSVITRVPASVWGKCSICASKCDPIDGGFLRHLHGDSWHNWDSFLFTYVLFCHQFTAIFLACVAALVITLRGDTIRWMTEHHYIAIIAIVEFALLMALQ